MVRKKSDFYAEAKYFDEHFGEVAEQYALEHEDVYKAVQRQLVQMYQDECRKRDEKAARRRAKAGTNSGTKLEPNDSFTFDVK